MPTFLLKSCLLILIASQCVGSEIICPLETSELQLRVNKEQQRGHTSSEGQGWKTILGFFQFARDHSLDGVELTDMCIRRGISCQGADSS